jgi:hypothetical protein
MSMVPNGRDEEVGRGAALEGGAGSWADAHAHERARDSRPADQEGLQCALSRGTLARRRVV